MADWRSFKELFSPILLFLCVTLGIVSYVQHEKLSGLEQRLNEGHFRLHKRHVTDIFNKDHKKWKEEMITNFTPLIEKLVHSSAKDFEKFCVKSDKICLPGPPGPKGEPGERGPPGPPGKPSERTVSVRATECCSRLSVPVLKGSELQQITATAGEPQLLPCSPSMGYPQPIVTWNSTTLITPDMSPNKDGLFIPFAAGRHEGIYECFIANIFGLSTKIIDLKVRGNITIDLSVPTEVYVQGVPSTATLHCNYTGVPEPDIKWHHLRPDGIAVSLNQSIVTTNESSILTITNPSFMDSGFYTCTARNRYEKQLSTGSLQVVAPPVILTPPRNQSELKGRDLILHCIVISNPLAIITWKFPVISGHKPFNAFENADGSVTIKDVQQINEGVYTCTATNERGSVSASATLDIIEPVTATIKYPLQSIRSERFVALDCRATGDPTPAITWTKLGGTLDTTNKRYIFLHNGDFIISSITKETEETDSGVYACSASNNVSAATAYAVVYFEHGKISCNENFENLNSVVGSAHRVECPPSCSSGGHGVYGSNPYSMNSPICSSAVHNGVIDENVGGVVFWYVIDGRAISFQGSSSNGITSQSSGPLFEAVMIVDRSMGVYPLTNTTNIPVIG